MPSVSKVGCNIFTRIAKSDVGNKLYTKMLNPKNENFVNNTLPLLETTLATTCAIVATGVQSKIDKRSKAGMQINNILKWGFSIGIAGGIAKGVGKFTDSVVENLKPELIPNAKHVAEGIKILIPAVSTICISRYIVPVCLVKVSTLIRDFIDEKLYSQKGKKKDNAK